jgi:hypothetical protein
MTLTQLNVRKFSNQVISVVLIELLQCISGDQRGILGSNESTEIIWEIQVESLI